MGGVGWGKEGLRQGVDYLTLSSSSGEAENKDTSGAMTVISSAINKESFLVVVVVVVVQEGRRHATLKTLITTTSK